MLNYTEQQVGDILSHILKTENFTFKPVGNHHLKRHLVYEIAQFNGVKKIFKLYYKDKKRSREIASLNLLSDSGIKCPKILDYGNLEDGRQWLITEYIEGEILDKVIQKLSFDNINSIFLELGEELGKMHSYRSFDYFGEWDQAGNSINNTRSYFQYFCNRMDAILNEIHIQDIPEKQLLLKAIEQIRNNYYLLDIQIESRLVHNDFEGRNILVKKIDSGYRLNGVIDFEGCYPGNPEENFCCLYFRCFLDNDLYKDSFFRGYNKYMEVNPGFEDRLYLYLLCFAVENCSWAYIKSPDYYWENISLLKKIIK